MKRFLLSLGFLLGFVGLAAAQVNTVPQVGVVSAVQKFATYSATSIGLVPASSATDVFCISAAASKSVSIKQITVTGTAGTLITVPITIVRRASLDTGGTPATTTALPVAAANYSTDPASTATLIAYTANPTLVDSSPGIFRSEVTSFNVTSALVASPSLRFQWGESISWFSHALNILKGTTQQVCVNLNTTTILSGVLNISITWVEG